MKANKMAILLFLLVVSSAVEASAERFTPIVPVKSSVDMSMAVAPGKPSAPAATYVDPYPVCNPAPSIAEVKGTFEYHDTLMTSSEAGKLGFGLGAVSGSGTQLLYIKDYSRGKVCLATDGKTKLLYGQSVRTIISLSDWDSKMNASYAMIAADASINHKNHQLHMYSTGVDNSQINTFISQISNKTFDVDTYAEYAAIEGRIINLIPNPATVNKVERLAIVDDSNDDLHEPVVKAYALYRIKEGESCQDAHNTYLKHYKDSVQKQNLKFIITAMYKKVTNACDNSKPSDESRLAAKEALLGLKVNYPWF